MSQFQDLYAKVLTDSEFRTRLVSAPSDALKSVGITPTPEILAALQKIIVAVTELGTDLNGPSAGLGPGCVA